MPWHLRVAAAGDLAEMQRVRAAAIAASAVGHYSRPQRRAWVASTSPADYPGVSGGVPQWGVVACRGGRLAGFGSLRLGERAHVWMAYVDPAHARQGIGRALMQALERAAREGGHARLFLAASLNAVPFYIALGYRARRPFCVRLPCLRGDGHVRLRVVKMERPLADPAAL